MITESKVLLSSLNTPENSSNKSDADSKALKFKEYFDGQSIDGVTSQIKTGVLSSGGPEHPSEKSGKAMPLDFQSSDLAKGSGTSENQTSRVDPSQLGWQDHQTLIFNGKEFSASHIEQLDPISFERLKLLDNTEQVEQSTDTLANSKLFNESQNILITGASFGSKDFLTSDKNSGESASPSIKTKFIVANAQPFGVDGEKDAGVFEPGIKGTLLLDPKQSPLAKSELLSSKEVEFNQFKQAVNDKVNLDKINLGKHGLDAPIELKAEDLISKNAQDKTLRLERLASLNTLTGNPVAEKISGGAQLSAEPSAINTQSQSATQSSMSGLVSNSNSLRDGTSFTAPLVLHSQKWQSNFAQKLAVMKMNGSHQAEIQLEPKELGPLTIRMQQSNGELQVTVAASHQQTRELFEVNYDKLKEQLAQHGLNLTEFEVKQDSSDASRREQTASFDNNKQSSNSSGQLAEGTETLQMTNETVRISINGLDVFA